MRDLAVRHGHPGTVSQWLAAGARLSKVMLDDFDNMNGFDCIANDMDIARFSIPVTGHPYQRRERLAVADRLAKGYDTILSMLIESGEDILPEGEEMLFEASRNGHDKVVSLLLAAGVDVHPKALKLAEEAGHNGVVEILKRARRRRVKVWRRCDESGAGGRCGWCWCADESSAGGRWGGVC